MSDLPEDAPLPTRGRLVLPIPPLTRSTCDEIANEVLAAHQRGVQVRVITDDDQSVSQGSDIQKFRDAGIPVRDDNSPYHMHHKTCVIDGELVINGSFNWSRQASIGNQENVMIIRSKEIAKIFTAHFEKLWVQFAANQRN